MVEISGNSDYDGSDDGDQNLGMIWGQLMEATLLMMAFEYDKPAGCLFGKALLTIVHLLDGH